LNALIRKFFVDNWQSIRDFLPSIEQYEEDGASYIKASDIDDINAFWQYTDDDGTDKYSDITFAVPPVVVPESINNIRDLGDDVRKKILHFYETHFAYLYPFQHACICLAKGESTDSFFVMLEKLKPLYKQAETILPDSCTYHLTKSSVKFRIERNDDATETVNSITTFDLIRPEGLQQKALCTRYERSPELRDACLKKYGYTCVICGFNFEERYGEIGKDFIHVHHLEGLAEKRESHESTPDKLRPVCPNCHAMLHRQKPALTPDELQKILKKYHC